MNQDIVFTPQIDSKNLIDQIKQLEKNIVNASGKKANAEVMLAPLESKLDSLRKQAEAYRDAIEDLNVGKNYLTGVANGQNGEKLYERIAANNELQKVNGQIAEQESLLKEVEKKIASIDEKAQGYRATIELATNTIERDTAEIGVAYSNLSQYQKEASNNTKLFEQGTKMVMRTMTNMLKRIFVFNLIRKGIMAVLNYMKGLLATDKEYQAQLARIKGALATAFQPIWNFIVPALKTVLSLFERIAVFVAKIVSMLFGTTAQQAAQSAQAMQDEASAISGVGSAAEKAKKQLAGFDEINQLSDDSSSGGGGGSSGSSAYDFSAMFEAGQRMSELEGIISGCLLALGAVLCFSGANIPLGIALLSMGALGLASGIAENWNLCTSKVSKALLVIAAASSLMLLAIGCVLCFSGANMPLGIGMIAVGAAGLAASATLDWNSVVSKLQGPIGDIVEIASGALLAIGMCLAFSGANIPLGLGLISVGAAGLASVIVANWETITELMKGPVGAITEIASGSLLAIGCVLCFSGANIPLGLGLISAGAVGLGTVVAANWDSIVSEMRGTVGKITAIASGSLIAIGLLLALSGVATPLGLSMIAAGSVGMVTTAAFNWDTVLGYLKKAWANISTWFTTYIAPIFTKEWWDNKLKSISDAVSEFDLSGKISELWGKVKSWFSENISPIFTSEYWTTKLSSLTEWFDSLDISVKLSSLWEKVKKWYSENIAPIFTVEYWTNKAASLTEWIESFDISSKLATAWANVKEWYNKTIAPIFTAEWWTNLFSSVGDGLTAAFKNGINAAINLMNNFIRWINSSMTFSWGSFEVFGQEVIPAGEFTLMTIPEIPLLAQGAVIPPNAPFMAMLGDQKNGTNIETPESLLRQIVREESGSNGNVSALLEQLISAVYSIKVGDDTIAKAANRGNRIINRAYGR